MRLLPIKCGKCKETLNKDDLITRDICNELTHIECTSYFDVIDAGTYTQVEMKAKLYTTRSLFKEKTCSIVDIPYIHTRL